MKNCLLMITCLASLSCATAKDSVLLGAGVGGVVGSGFGAAAGHQQGQASKGAAIGGTVGAAIGGLAGWLDYHKRGNGKSQSQSQSTTAGDAPSLTAPEVRRVWVPSRIENNKFIEAHWIYLIDKQSSWQMPEVDVHHGK